MLGLVRRVRQARPGYLGYLYRLTEPERLFLVAGNDEEGFVAYPSDEKGEMTGVEVTWPPQALWETLKMLEERNPMPCPHCGVYHRTSPAYYHSDQWGQSTLPSDG